MVSFSGPPARSYYSSRTAAGRENIREAARKVQPYTVLVNPQKEITGRRPLQTGDPTKPYTSPIPTGKELLTHLKQRWFS